MLISIFKKVLFVGINTVKVENIISNWVVSKAIIKILEIARGFVWFF